MSDFANAFLKCIDDRNIEAKDARIQRNMEQFNFSVEDAILLDNNMISLCRNIHRIVGNSIDRLPAHMRDAGLRCYVGTVHVNLGTLMEYVTIIMAGLPWEVLGTDITDGCNCVSCQGKRLLTTEVRTARSERA